MEEKVKISFLKRIKKAIFNLDEYSIFIGEKFGVAIKYLFLLLLFLSIILSFVSTFIFSKQIKKGINYLENEFPDFSFENYKLKLDDYAEGYDKEYDFLLIADSKEDIEQSKINEYIKKAKTVESSIIFLSDKFIYNIMDLSVEYEYKDILKVLEINNPNKAQILDRYYNFGGISSLATIYMISNTISTFIVKTFQTIMDCIIVAIVGICVARICGIMIKPVVAGSLAIYSLTLSIFCILIYSIAYLLTGFEIKYFQAMYLMIAYVYIIASIFIIKTDLIKPEHELIVKTPLKKKKEDLIDKKEEEKKDNSEKDGEKDDTKSEETNEELDKSNKEPDGSEI